MVLAFERLAIRQSHVTQGILDVVVGCSQGTTETQTKLTNSNRKDKVDPFHRGVALEVSGKKN